MVMVVQGHIVVRPWSSALNSKICVCSMGDKIQQFVQNRTQLFAKRNFLVYLEGTTNFPP
jgi:hypothetical protein